MQGLAAGLAAGGGVAEDSRVASPPFDASTLSDLASSTSNLLQHPR